MDLRNERSVRPEAVQGPQHGILPNTSLQRRLGFATLMLPHGARPDKSSRKPNEVPMKERVRRCLRVSAVALALCGLPWHGHAQTAVKFALFGDLGYRPQEEPLIQNVLDDINKATLAFVVHVGDLSSPRFACTDELLAKRLAQFSALAHPLVFTPGDNDWTDCHEA